MVLGDRAKAIMAIPRLHLMLASATPQLKIETVLGLELVDRRCDISQKA